ncbi:MULTISPECIES: branched-chain amino acid ABC transporter substrate-binding protein [Streptomyces]|uniref:Branched-chain amino acid ABC transporter substrate-binding protein n=2 Tax=Streptomyces TaxID=1883 RepID=A0A3R7IYR4_9ACTN|nr:MULTISPECIES: branched-chain amino acid ABC transporter substrate-binding protein [Streptomyces]KNE83851.1 branched-chain amino acid ABC transporter substrate-binding protein [Streptomyces fradiae]OFA55728.1 branched chain amino acid ABC transporter substrate-binding protein [Streptomyces fradiae]PQM23918.1 branched-chain amino acid ABC transporter substrate-binding protein [Streptomyces xinghaiensis]RKM91973.1 branched-chain amino acid ABC transporter substrate-binding protein [Streptomyces
MTLIRRGTTTAAAMALGLTITACGGNFAQDSSGDDSSGPIKLGMLTPLTGSSAAIGPYMKDGAQLAVDEINAKGGVDGRKLSLTVEDEACDPKTAAAGAAKLVSADIDISVGGYCSSATLPTLSIFGKAHIPMLIPAANSADLVSQKQQNVFLLNGTGIQQAEAASKFIKAAGSKGVALVDDNTSYSTDITKRTEEGLKQSGVEVVNHQSVTAGESDYSGAINAVLDSKADFIYWTGYYQEGGLLIKQLKAAGYKGEIMVADGSVDAKLIQIAGQKNAQGVFATMTQTPQTIPGGEAWVAKYKEKFGSEPGPYSTQAYDAVRVAAEAVRKAGSTDGQAVTSALEQIDGLEIFSGPLKFTAQHTLSAGGFDILVVRDDNFVLNK